MPMPVNPHLANAAANDLTSLRPIGAAVAARYAWALARLSLASIFLWAFFDKTFGLGYGTPAARSWVNGGSPTNGFLSSTKGWFSDFFRSIAGHPLTDALFMAALLGIGVALLLGIGMRVAAASGSTLMLLMYLAAIPGVAGTTNPFMDDHIVYAIVLVGLALVGAGDTLGLGKAWGRLPIVERFPALK